jgi:hypothetical protein
MSEIKVKVEANYGTVVLESDNPKVVARVIAIILDTEAEDAEALTPEQSAINVLKEELETLRSDLSMEKYNRGNIQKKLDEAVAKLPAETEA